MDEDGFYRGETMDGQTGLVPSNYVERVADAWLGAGGVASSGAKPPSSSAPASISGARADSPSFQLSVPAHLTAIAHDFSTDACASALLSQNAGNTCLPDSGCPYPPPDVSRVTVQEIKEPDSPRVPWPRELTIEKRLSRSVVLGWQPPEESLVAISQYHVCIDSTVRAVVPGSYKCRALVEEISLEGSVNVSVRAVTELGHSPDAACTVAVGTEAAIAPQHLRVFNVTPVSACIRWHPSNSNAEHVVSLNSVKIGVCPPAVFQVQVHGLSPSTIYRISVRTKHPKAVLEQRPVERCIDFKTLPKIGLPDAPSSVSVEAGPQPGTLLVSWQPVLSQPKSPSRAAVQSYLVYADGRNIAQVPSATADHVLLRLADLSDDPPIFITVRTRTREGAVSSDSNVARVPRGLPAALPSFGHSAPSGGLNPRSSSLSPLLAGQLSTQSTAPLHQPLQTLTNLQNPLTGPLSDPLLVKEMASSFPSAYQAAGVYSTNDSSAYGIPGHFRAHGPSPLLMSSSGPAATSFHTQPQAPYSAPVLPPSALPPGYPGGAISQQYPSAFAVPNDLGLAQNPTASTLSHWKSSGAGASASAGASVLPGAGAVAGAAQQYYTFHPHVLRADAGGRGVEERPSVHEMENNYLLRYSARHRCAEWAGAQPEVYGARGGGRACSADALPAGMLSSFRPSTGRLVPPRLARVKSESGFGTRSEPDLRPALLEDDCRWFVALFDYDHHMSPNVNAEHEELSFRKHQLIKVFGDVDADGFFHGQIGSRTGLVPSNMVIEIAKDDLMPRRPPPAAVLPGAAVAAGQEAPTLRRARWGSLKSRSYEQAGERRSGYHLHRREVDYASLDRRETREYRERDRERYRRAVNGRGGGSDYDYGRGGAYDDRDIRDRDRYGGSRDPAYRSSEYEEEYGRGGPREYDRERDRGDLRGEHRERRHPESYRDREEYGNGGGAGGRYERERDRERDRERETHYSTSSGPARYGEQGPSGGATSHGGHGSKMAASNHLIQPGGHFPGGGGGQPFTGNGQVLTGVQHHHQHQQQLLQQGMSHLSVSGVPQQTPCGTPSGYSMQQPQQQQMGGQQPLDPIRNGAQTKRVMVAKFDYDSRQLSPNVDAEQVELSFRQGDAITIYGEMDEDGFYMGELGGQRGLVPSNFLQTSPLTSLAPPAPPPGSEIGGAGGVRKGVAFSQTAGVAAHPTQGADSLAAARKAAPARQASQVSASGSAASGGAAKGAAAKKASVAAPPAGGAKQLSKKISDVGKTPNARKTSAAVKKGEPSKKK